MHSLSSTSCTDIQSICVAGLSQTLSWVQNSLDHVIPKSSYLHVIQRSSPYVHHHFFGLFAGQSQTLGWVQKLS